MPGRPRKPTELKRQKGTLQPCRTNVNEPQLDPELLPPPDGLAPRVVEAYYSIGQRLLDMRVMTRADVGAVVGAAQAWVDWREACEAIDANGSQLVDDPILDSDNEVVGHRTKAHPAVAIRNEADRRLRGWYQSLGLTPADRSKVNAQKEQKKSDLAKLLEMPA